MASLDLLLQISFFRSCTCQCCSIAEGTLGWSPLQPGTWRGPRQSPHSPASSLQPPGWPSRGRGQRSGPRPGIQKPAGAVRAGGEAVLGSSGGQSPRDSIYTEIWRVSNPLQVSLVLDRDGWFNTGIPNTLFGGTNPLPLFILALETIQDWEKCARLKELWHNAKSF